MSSDLLTRLDDAIEANAERQLDLVKRLVRANSANPLPPTEASQSAEIEKEAAGVIAEALGETGLEPEFKGATEARPNVVATMTGDGGKRLVLNGHLDTVPAADGWKSDPFEPTIKGRRLYGLGALDMKASLATFVYLARAFRDAGVQLKGDLILTFVVDEETGACSELGTKYLLENGLTADAAIVAEPGTHKVAIGHRGGYRFRITTVGESVHTGTSGWERGAIGRNAIIDMGRVVQELQHLKLPVVNTPSFPGRKSVLTFPTLIEGGSSISTVPGQCIAYGDCRLLPGVRPDEVENLIRERLQRLPDITYTLQTLVSVPAVEISPDEPIVDCFARATKEVLGTEPSCVGAGPWNDGWMFITRGIPAICGFGPDGGNPHAANEFVFVDSVVATTRIFARAIVDYLGVCS